jgi:hypothetical protein
MSGFQLAILRTRNTPTEARPIGIAAADESVKDFDRFLSEAL